MYKWFWCCVASQKGVWVGPWSWTDQWFRMIFFLVLKSPGQKVYRFYYTVDFVVFYENHKLKFL